MSTRLIQGEIELQRLVERQYRRWELAKTMRLDTPEAPKDLPPFVAISRQVGSGGAEIARKLGERLDWPVFDREILHLMAGNDTVRESLYAGMDEHDAGWVEQVVHATVAGRFPPHEFFPRLTETILTLARGASAIFLGRGADLILPRNHGLRIRVVAPLEQRVETFGRQHYLEAARAREEVRRIDRERAEFIQHRFHRDVDDPTRCDLMINTGALTVDESVEVILALLRKREIAK